MNIASNVQAILGLSNLARVRPVSAQMPDAQGVTVNASPSVIKPVDYTPQDIAQAYNWPSITNAANGSGETIAIATAESTNLASSDYDSFWRYYGLPTQYHNVSVVTLGGSGCTSCATADTNETTLDVEWSGAMAPGAALIVYDYDTGDGSNNDLTAAELTDVFNAIVTANTAQVMTTSFGPLETQVGSSLLATGDSIFKEAAAQGISVFAADGDYGAAYGPVYPSTDNYVAAAGGTTLHLNPYSESAWTGSGGTVSTYYPEPYWQTGTGVPYNCLRNTSDIAMNADGATPYSWFFQGVWGTAGGTSFVAPQLAGLIAVLDSQTGSRLGQANLAIDADANSSNYATDFHDITTGSNGYPAGPGWDHPTGWGSPNATNLIAHLGKTPVTVATAYNSSFTTDVGTPVACTIPVSGEGGGALTFNIVNPPSHGTAVLDAIGDFTYTPATGFTGGDSFTYNANDSAGTSNIATVSFTVLAILSAPINFTAEYEGCVQSMAKYLVTWQRGADGTPATFEAQEEYDGGPWLDFYTGARPSTGVKLPSNTGVSLRVRAENGSVLSAWSNTIGVGTPNCGGPPP